MARSKFELEGMEKLLKDLKRLGNVPQKHVTPAAKKGMRISLKDAKANAPYDTGALQKGIIAIGERSSRKGKKVYRIVFDRAMNHIFQKTAVHAKQLRVYHGYDRKTKDPRYELKQYYYPVSQEYGFFAKDGRYIPGFRFITDSLNDNAAKISKTMVDEMQKKIDAEIRKARLR